MDEDLLDDERTVQDVARALDHPLADVTPDDEQLLLASTVMNH